MSQKIIQECLTYLYETNEAFKDWDESDSFIEKKDQILIKNILDIHINKWNSKISFNAWSYIEKYQDFLIDSDYVFSEIEKPDFYLNDFKCEEIFFNIENNKIYISHKIENLFPVIFKEQDKSYIELNIMNIFYIYNILNNYIKIDLDTLKKINLYLNAFEDNNEELDFFNSNNIDIKLRNFQKIGVLFALLNKRVIIADEMGLGKTIQSLSAINISNAFPCLIICPSSLKLNWLSEIKTVNKNTSGIIIKNEKNINEDSNFYIINYESLHNYVELIKNKGFKSIILDESHYIKNKEAKRTKNINKIINGIEYRFSLTGTCIVNNPSDLISPLKLINQLDHFINEDKFTEKYCNPKKTKWGIDKTGSSNIEELSKKLRESCLIRRRKKDVLKELPDKVVSIIPLELSNKKDYKLLLKDFSKLNKVEKIGKLDKLRQFVAMDKIITLECWIKSFLDSGEKLVVFAHHKSIQNELLKKFPFSARIISSDSEEIREHNKEKFQNDINCNLIICSLKSASLGFTLTAASNVLFVEFDWCSTINRQAEDRCHRIGQKDSVNAWYFIVKNTIEEHIWKVSYDKEVLINKIYNDDNKKDLLIEDYKEEEENMCCTEEYMSIYNEVIQLIEEEEKYYFS